MKKEKEIITEEDKKIVNYEGKFLHPSLDVREDVLALGFRYRAELQKEKNLFLIVKKGNAEIIREETIKIDGENYYFETRQRKLARIEEKWGLNDLQAFAEDFSKGKIGTTPKPKDVINEIETLAHRYIELEKDIDYLLLSVWAIGTYFFPIFSAYPYLNIKAPKRSGKSQCLNFLRQVCFNAIKARPTLPALRDTIDALRGTYLIDQADSLERKGGEEMLDTLADGYKKSGGKKRIINFDKSKRREVLEFETYGPKAFASIKELPEDLRDRCLTIPLMRSQNNFHDPDEGENWREVRGRIYKLLANMYFEVGADYFARKVKYNLNPEITGRELELWLPLEVMFYWLGLEEKTEEAKKRFFQWYSFSEYQPNEFEEQVIKVVLKQLESKSEIVLSPKKISELISSDYFSAQETPKQKAVKVGWAIKKFNLSSEKKTRTKEGINYLFEKEKVERVYNGYFKKNHSSPAPAEKNSEDMENSAVQ